MTKKIIALILACLTLLFAFSFFAAANSDEAENSGSAFAENEQDISTRTIVIIPNAINLKFATAAHGMSIEQTQNLLKCETENIGFEWKRIFEIKNNKDANKKIYAGNQYEATIILTPDEGYEIDSETQIVIGGAELIKVEYNDDKSTTVVFKFVAHGSFYDKIFTFFHNLFY